MYSHHQARNLFVSLIVVIAFGLLSGCGRPQQQASPEQIQALLGALGGGQYKQHTRPAVDFSTEPKIAMRTINNDSLGLTEALQMRFEEIGALIVFDPNDADVVLSGTIQYVGDPAKQPNQINSIRNQSRAAGVAGGVAALGMGIVSPAYLVTGGARLLASAASEAMTPNVVQGVVMIHVRQGNEIWDLNLNHTVEAPKAEAERKLSIELSHAILSQLGG